MQIKTTWRFYLTQLEWRLLNNNNYNNNIIKEVGEDVEKK
jgi:hypothetical protein